MNVSEIITNPPRDEYIDQYSAPLKQTPVVSKISGLNLHKLSTPTEIEYGLFNESNLVGYFSLEHFDKNKWTVKLVQLAQAYKGKGLGTFFYDYAVMNDKLTILSDATNTDGVHGSKGLWLKLKNNNRYTVKGYDVKTNTMFDPKNPEDIYLDNNPDVRWIAIPGNETINESLIRIQALMKKRHVVWYGSGTTSETYFNF
jgi:hypothetical protein